MADDDAAPNDGELEAGWSALLASVRSVERDLSSRLDRLGISMPTYAMLTLLLGAPDQRLPLNQIARDIAMTSGGMTKLADRLARDGLIDRRGSSSDRRVVFAALTEKGHELAESARIESLDVLRTRVGGRITATQLSSLAAAAHAIIEDGSSDAADDYRISPRSPDAPDRRQRGSR